MNTDNPPFDPQVVKFLLKSAHGGWLGLEYRDHGDEWFELALPWREELVGDPKGQVLASGPILSLMDTATSLSVWNRLGRFVPIATLDLRIDYMRPARSGETVVGRGECYRTTNSVAFVRGIAHDGDANDPVAHVAGCFMRTGTVTP